MKYKVKLLTQSGIIEMIISENENLELITQEIIAKHGTFITLESQPIN